MFSSTSVTTQSSWLLPLKSSAKPEWPDPELSLGRPCRDLGRNKCWEVTGPAQSVLDCIFPKVKSLLESRNEYLNEKEPIPVAIIFGLYMIGRSEKNANPTFLFTCEKKAPRRKALNIIMESDILSPYSGVLLAESARSPLALRPAVSLGSEEGIPPNPNEMFNELVSDEPSLLDFDELHDIYFPNDGMSCDSGGKRAIYRDAKEAFNIYLAASASPSDGPRGMLVNIYSQYQPTEPCRCATIGGFVYCENKDLSRTFYGITVAHVFSHDATVTQIPQEDDSTEEDDVEFSFYGQHGDDEEQDEEFVEITSRGSVSPNLESSPEIVTASPSNRADQEYFRPVTAPVFQSGLIGTLHASSDGGLGASLDWAMIELNVGSIEKLKELPYVNPCGIGGKQLEDRSVFTYSSSGKKLLGTMSSNQTLLKLPGAQTFQEVWVVRFDGVLRKGDCGSWVVDDATGHLYGHLVAGHLESGLGYIVPAYQIIEDMKKNIDGKLVLLHDPVGERPLVKKYSELYTRRRNAEGFSTKDSGITSFVFEPNKHSRIQQMTTGNSLWSTTPASLMSFDSESHYFDPISPDYRFSLPEVNARELTQNLPSHLSPALNQVGTASDTSSSQVNKPINARKVSQTSGRGMKRRSDIGSVEISPALRPRISPTIKPLLPGRFKLSGDPGALLLASRSNYQNLLEGTNIPGVSYPTELSATYYSKRISHKIAEQGRRNRINSALLEIQSLLPRGSEHPLAPSSDSGYEGSGESKASTVERAIEYIKQLKQEVADANKRAEDAEHELKLKTKEGSDFPTNDAI